MNEKESSNGGNMGDQVLARIKAKIVNWDYPPGYHLREQALSEEYRVSRVPVRQALCVLEEQGYVERFPNRGCHVKQPRLKDLEDLYDMRLALERFVVTRLAERGTLLPATIRELRAFWEAYLGVGADTPIDRPKVVEADVRFHMALAEATDNPHIVRSLFDINERLRVVRMLDISSPHRLQSTSGQHLSILDAIEAGDASAARRFVSHNILNARQKVGETVKQYLGNIYV